MIRTVFSLLLIASAIAAVAAIRPARSFAANGSESAVDEESDDVIAGDTETDGDMPDTEEPDDLSAE